MRPDEGFRLGWRNDKTMTTEFENRLDWPRSLGARRSCKLFVMRAVSVYQARADGRGVAAAPAR